MARLGSKEILLSDNYLVPKDEHLIIDLDPKDGHVLHLKIIFTENDSIDKAQLNIDGNEDGGTIEFVNWTRPLGHSLQKPIQLAELDDNGDVISFIATASKSGDLYRLAIQFMKESVNGSE